jgi:hypothetical protein
MIFFAVNDHLSLFKQSKQMQYNFSARWLISNSSLESELQFSLCMPGIVAIYFYCWNRSAQGFEPGSAQKQTKNLF